MVIPDFAEGGDGVVGAFVRPKTEFFVGAGIVMVHGGVDRRTYNYVADAHRGGEGGEHIPLLASGGDGAAVSSVTFGDAAAAAALVGCVTSWKSSSESSSPTNENAVAFD